MYQIRLMSSNALPSQITELVEFGGKCRVGDWRLLGGGREM